MYNVHVGSNNLGRVTVENADKHTSYSASIFVMSHLCTTNIPVKLLYGLVRLIQTQYDSKEQELHSPDSYEVIELYTWRKNTFYLPGRNATYAYLASKGYKWDANEGNWINSPE